MPFLDYNVSSFAGRKSFIISTTSWAGGKNSFLGIAYITVGTICIILALVFLVIHIKFGHLWVVFAYDKNCLINCNN